MTSILAMIYISLITAVTANNKTYIIEAQDGYSTAAQQVYRSAATSGTMYSSTDKRKWILVHQVSKLSLFS